MWQTLRNDYQAHNFELVAVGLDVLGNAGCQGFIEAAAPEHPSLIDRHHVLARLFGVINIPSSIWIDENFNIVRPAETAPAPPTGQPPTPPEGLPSELPPRFVEMMGQAAQITGDPEGYHAALKDWVVQGSNSQYALSPQAVVERSRPRTQDTALGHAHFELATQLEIDGDHAGAIEHFRAAHRLVPDSWTFRRQAWSLEASGMDGPLARFWQGPQENDPQAWPYEGDWVADIKKVGAANYNDPWAP